MHREDDSNYLLYIEPPASARAEQPVEDVWTDWLDEQMARALAGTSRYRCLSDDGRSEHSFCFNNSFRGVHFSDFGEFSDNRDYLLPCGLITNALAPTYLRHYREAIPESEWMKLERGRRSTEGIPDHVWVRS